MHYAYVALAWHLIINGANRYAMSEGKRSPVETGLTGPVAIALKQENILAQ